jgi:hypothetical protein
MQVDPLFQRPSLDHDGPAPASQQLILHPLANHLTNHAINPLPHKPPIPHSSRKAKPTIADASTERTRGTRSEPPPRLASPPPPPPPPPKLAVTGESEAQSQGIGVSQQDGADLRDDDGGGGRRGAHGWLEPRHAPP